MGLMERTLAKQLLPRDVIRLKLTGARRGRGRKVVVTLPIERESDTIGVNFFQVRQDRSGQRYLGDAGWTSLKPSDPVEYIGVWRDGEMRVGAPGWLQTNGESPQKGAVPRMATTRAGKKKAAGRKPAAKSGSNGGGTRASADELDRLGAKVVDLRDNKGKSWGEIEEALDIAPGRLRSLYNRGGGEPRERAAATPPKKAAASGRAGKKRSAKR
jgi:hypothetical protein